MKRVISILLCIMIFSCAGISVCAKSEYDIKVKKIDESVAEIYPLIDGMRRFKAQNGRYGFLNENYEIAIEPIYAYADDFNNSTAFVRLPESKTLIGIDKRGETVIPNVIDCDENGIGIVTDGEYKGFVNESGESLTEIKYKKLTPFKNGVALANPDDMHSYTMLIDKDFNEHTLPEGQKFIDVLDSGLIVVRDENSLYGLFDRGLKEVVPCMYELFFSYDMQRYIYDSTSDEYIRRGGPYRVACKGKYGYIDKYGEIVIPVIYDSLGEFMPDGLMTSRLNGEYGLINSSGEIIYDDYLQYSDNIYLARDDTSVWFVDLKDGSSINAEDIDIISDYVDGVAIAAKLDPIESDGLPDRDKVYCGLVDVYGNVIRDFDIRIWDEIRYVGHGTYRYISHLYKISEYSVAVRIGDKWGYMDLSGNMIVEPQYDMAYDFKYGYAKVEIDEETYHIDKQGNRYDELDIVEKADYEVTDIEKSIEYNRMYAKKRGAEKNYYFFYDLYMPTDYDFFAFNNCHLFLNGEYGALKDNDTIIFESVGDRIVDANGNVLVENCIVEPYGEPDEKEHLAMYFTFDKNILVKTTDGNYIIEVSKKETPDEIIFTIGEKSAIVNGEACEVEIAPAIADGQVVVPLRFVSESLGARVCYTDKTKLIAVTLGDKTFSHILGTDTAIANGETITLKHPTYTENDRTYIDLNSLAEALGLNVEWLKPGEQVRITV